MPVAGHHVTAFGEAGDTRTWIRSVDESTYRAVLVRPTSSPRTGQGSMAARNSMGGARDLDVADVGETELEERRQPGRFEAKPCSRGRQPPQQCRRWHTRAGGTGRAARCPNVRAGRNKARPRSGRRGRGPTALARAPCGGAAASRSPQLEEPKTAPFRVGAEELVDAQLGPVGAARYIDEQVPEQPVHEPRRGGVPVATVRRSSSAKAISSS